MRIAYPKSDFRPTLSEGRVVVGKLNRGQSLAGQLPGRDFSISNAGDRHIPHGEAWLCLGDPRCLKRAWLSAVKTHQQSQDESDEDDDQQGLRS